MWTFCEFLPKFVKKKFSDGLGQDGGKFQNRKIENNGKNWKKMEKFYFFIHFGKQQIIIDKPEKKTIFYTRPRIFKVEKRFFLRIF